MKTYNIAQSAVDNGVNLQGSNPHTIEIVDYRYTTVDSVAHIVFKKTLGGSEISVNSENQAMIDMSAYAFPTEANVESEFLTWLNDAVRYSGNATKNP